MKATREKRTASTFSALKLSLCVCVWGGGVRKGKDEKKKGTRDRGHVVMVVLVCGSATDGRTDLEEVLEGAVALEAVHHVGREEDAEKPDERPEAVCVRVMCVCVGVSQFNVDSAEGISQSVHAV
jgi:hypothetical protein